MILEGNERGYGANLAIHLLNPKDNDHVTVHSVDGFCSDDLVGAFAEVEAIADVHRNGYSDLLEQATAYVTLEPCVMCAGALAWAQLGKLIYGAADEKRGFMRFGRPLLHPKTKIEFGVLNEEASALMRSFFERKRF